MLKLFYIFILFLISNHTFSQNQANIWYFGHYRGLDFNADTIKVIEGPSSFHNPVNSVCNISGELLCYLDDRSKMYDTQHHLVEDFKINKNHQITRSVFVPHPRHKQVFYLFTIQRQNSNYEYPPLMSKNEDYFQGSGFSLAGVNSNINDNSSFYLYYHIFLIDSHKNVICLKQQEKLLDFATKINTLTVLKHKNSYSVIVLDRGKNMIHTYSIESDGFDESSQKINLEQYPDFVGYQRGYIQVEGGSVQGNKLVLTTSFSGNRPNYFHILNFDKDNNEIQKIAKIPYPPTDIVTSLEFSPDGKKLYINTHLMKEIKRQHILYQYDLTSENEQKIADSKLRLERDMTARREPVVYDLQLAPNGKIYGVSYYRYMYCIQHPNEKGEACGFEPRAIDLGENANGGLYLPKVNHLLGR